MITGKATDPSARNQESNTEKHLFQNLAWEKKRGLHNEAFFVVFEWDNFGEMEEE